MIRTDAVASSLERLAGPLEFARPRFDVEPLPLVAPTSVEQVCELLRLAARDALRVIPLGLGSKLGYCGTPGHVDFLLSTRKLTRVVSHVPDDGTVTVEAGMSMAELRRRCRDGGHFLTPDVARPERCTLGGVVAAGESGLDRLRFGPLRHHVLGLQVVLADGTLTKSGGQLVKNVTGFDLHRLYTGSHGTLCVIVAASLRLFPEPEHELWIATGARDMSAAFELARRALALGLRLVSLSLAGLEPPRDDARAALFARLAGKRAPVEAERERLGRVWPAHTMLSGTEARNAADEMRDTLAFASSARPLLHATCAPQECEPVAAELERQLDEHGVAHRIAVQPGLAQLDVELHSGVDDAGRLGELVHGLRAALRAHGVQLALRNAPRAALVALDPFGEPAPGLELMRALQRKLDPRGVFATGRFHGGL